jgi:hypothetical protein
MRTQKGIDCNFKEKSGIECASIYKPTSGKQYVCLERALRALFYRGC